MPFAEQLFAGAFPVALEITPPQQRLTRVLLRRASLLGDAASAINVIHRPGRQSSLEASVELLEAGREVVWHLVTRGRARENLEADLNAAAAAGIRQVLCIRGDHEAPDLPGAPTIREVIALARSLVPGGTVGATLNQHAPKPDAVLRNLLAKLEAGATYVQTQPVFDIDALRAPLEAVKREAPDTRVVAMVMPLRTPAAASAIAGRLGIALPASLLQSLDDEERAWEAFEQQVAALLESGLADGVAVMTYEMDLPPEAGGRILSALEHAGVSVSARVLSGNS